MTNNKKLLVQSFLTENQSENNKIRTMASLLNAREFSSTVHHFRDVTRYRLLVHVVSVRGVALPLAACDRLRYLIIVALPPWAFHIIILELEVLHLELQSFISFVLRFQVQGTFEQSHITSINLHSF